MTSRIKRDYLSVLIISTIMLIFIIYPVKGYSMGLFDFFKVYQASEFKGVLTNAGKPLSGVSLERKINENDDYVTTQKTVTDENGNFIFSAVSRFGLARFSMNENRYIQEITFSFEDVNYNAFYTAKSDVAINDEFSYFENKKEIRVPLNFDCELTNPDEGVLFKNNTYTGICRLREKE